MKNKGARISSFLHFGHLVGLVYRSRLLNLNPHSRHSAGVILKLDPTVFATCSRWDSIDFGVAFISFASP